MSVKETVAIVLANLSLFMIAVTVLPCLSVSSNRTLIDSSILHVMKRLILYKYVSLLLLFIIMFKMRMQYQFKSIQMQALKQAQTL